MSQAGERAIKMRRFLNEYQYATGGRALTDNLPDPGQLRTRIVSMPIETLVRFRNDYLLLAGFAALKCDVELEKLCQLDLLAPFLKEAIEEAEAGRSKGNE